MGGAFPPSTSADRRLVIVAALYHIYLDESGTHDASEAVIVAGFVANASEWEVFSEQWSDALAKWEIKFFHMTDFENRQQQFSSWDEPLRRERLNHLLGLIRAHTQGSIGYGIPKSSFDRILSKPAKLLCGDAYGLAAIGCFFNAAKAAQIPKVDGWIRYVMESRGKGNGAVLKLYKYGSEEEKWLENTRIVGLSFEDKRLYPPLQAADILAYELYKHLPRQLRKDDQWPERYPLQQLNFPLRQWHYADDDELRATNEYLTGFWNKHNSGM